jgi:hypothetical protein
VTCAVSFVFVERFAYSRPNLAYRRLVSQLANRFKRRTAEHLLHHIQAQLTAQAALQRELSKVLVNFRGEPADSDRTERARGGK